MDKDLEDRQKEAQKVIREALLNLNLEELSLLGLYISGLIKQKVWEQKGEVK